MAEYIEIRRTVALDGPINFELLQGYSSVGEHQAHQFVITVTKAHETKPLTGSVTAKVIRPDNKTILVVGSISNGSAVIRLHQDCYNIFGRLKISIFNTENSVTTCIYKAYLFNDQATTDTVIDSGDAVPDVADVVAAQEAMQAALDAAVNRTNAAIAGIQPQIDTSVAGMRADVNAAIQSATTATNAANTAADAANQAAQAGDSKFVRYDAAQALTGAQKAVARGNISVISKEEMTLQLENIPGTVQSIAFDASGNVQSITHMAGSTAVRTDVFTFGDGAITEVRTLATGESLTIVTDTDTLETTTTYAG